MTKLRQILIQRAAEGSLKGISRKTGVALRTVKKYVRGAEATGRSIPELLELDDAALASCVQEPAQQDENARLLQLEAQFPYFERELRRVGVTRQLLWDEYKSGNPDGYNYSRFCHYFQQWQGRQKAVMHLEHKSGDKLFIDYAGKKLKVMDWVSGREIEVEVFVATLGASGYTYVEASPSQQLEDFIASVENALHFLGGVPAALVPDNLKSAVTQSSRYEPKVNETFADFANHYGTSVLPTRAYKPRDKAHVENAVRITYQRIYALLRDRDFHSIEALNHAIRPLLDQHNARPLQGREESRLDRFEALDKPELAPLPTDCYEIKRHKWVTVQKNSHVRLGEDAHYYSVPYQHIGKKVKLTYTRRTVEVYCKLERVAFHKRNKSRFGYSSTPEHLPSNHRYVSDWNPDFFLNQALRIGPPVVEMFKAIFERKIHPEQAYKSCNGILHLKKRFTPQRVAAACQRALSHQCIGYGYVKTILEKGLDKLAGGQEDQPGKSSSSHIPQNHKNIRGKNQYK